uniref:Uncharacterized protein n=1 Tax=Ditylenchus dipsaci TaxID=166011 RepID=A0A915DL33_9BILA
MGGQLDGWLNDWTHWLMKQLAWHRMDNCSSTSSSNRKAAATERGRRGKWVWVDGEWTAHPLPLSLEGATHPFNDHHHGLDSLTQASCTH